jgi:hypothetical protein
VVVRLKIYIGEFEERVKKTVNCRWEVEDWNII